MLRPLEAVSDTEMRPDDVDGKLLRQTAQYLTLAGKGAGKQQEQLTWIRGAI